MSCLRSLKSRTWTISSRNLNCSTLMLTWPATRTFPMNKPRSKKQSKKRTTRTSVKKKHSRQPAAKTGSRKTARKTGMPTRGQRKKTRRRQQGRDPGQTAPQAESARLQKVLAAAGMGSRRSLEERIEAGDVMLDGKPARLGDSVKHGSRVSMNGRSWRAESQRPEHRTRSEERRVGEEGGAREP